MAERPQTETVHPAGHGHETFEASIRGIVWGGVGLVLLLIATLAGMYFFARTLAEREVARRPKLPPTLRGQQMPPEPRVAANQARELQEMEHAQEQILTSYGWVNREEQIARIPIERAMELLLENPPPVRQEAGSPKEPPQGAPREVP